MPQCADGTAPEDCTHEIWGSLTPGGKDLHLAAIHMHCHAPTCLAMELWNNKTGELVCRQRPIYGGTGDATVGERIDEPGYIFTPPCLWGAEAGLEPMPSCGVLRTSNIVRYGSLPLCFAVRRIFLACFTAASTFSFDW